MGFLQLFQQIENQHQICDFWSTFWILVKNFVSHILKTSKPKARKTAPKNEKHILQVCLRIKFFIHIQDQSLHTLNKCQNLYCLFNISVQFTKRHIWTWMPISKKISHFCVLKLPYLILHLRLFVAF